jgi:hypothetical protein
MHVRTTATELAQWLEQQGGSWHVEGEPVLAKSLPLPTPASSLVEVLRRRSADASDLAMLAPEATALSPDAPVSASEIATAAHVIDGQRVFQLAWIRPDGTVADSWLLAEQERKPESAGDGAAARGVVAAFRASMSTRSTRGTPR